MSASTKELTPPADSRGESAALTPATAAAHVWLVDRAGRIQAADGALAESTCRDPRLRAAIQRVLIDGAEVWFDLAACDDFSKQSPTRVRIRPLMGNEGVLALVELVEQTLPADVERRDPLTGLADRSALHARVSDWRQNAAQRPVRFALLFLDVDGFKQINDQHGHAAGDRVLRTLASRWLACVRDADLIVRYGGDEFVVLLHEATSDAEIAPVVRRLRQATEQPLDESIAPAGLRVTIGVAICTSDDASIDDLLAAADRDMYAQKRNSHNRPDDA